MLVPLACFNYMSMLDFSSSIIPTEYCFINIDNNYIAISIQVLIVAGGMGDKVSDLLSSTEKLTTGATAWTTVKPLPRKLYSVASVSMDNKVFITGKSGGV